MVKREPFALLLLSHEMRRYLKWNKKRKTNVKCTRINDDGVNSIDKIPNYRKRKW